MNKDTFISGIRFLAIWLLFGYAAGIYQNFHKLPMGVHQSAQCDRASLAQNFYYGGFHFLYPEVNENRCIDGIVSCELPLPSYLAACLYKVFGYHEFYFRLLTYCFFSLGMMALFFLLKTRMSELLSMALILLLHSSPILLFYCSNFLPDISSLGLILVAWLLFFLQHIPHPYLPAFKSKWMQILFILCLGLGIAIKTTSLLQWLTMFLVYIISLLPVLKCTILHKRKLLFSLIASFIIPLSWYLWSRHLSLTHNSQYFMMSLPSSETLESYEIAWQVYLANWPSQTFSYPLISIAVSLLVLTVFLKRFIQKELWLISIINSAGAIAFLFIMIEQFKYHDYYVICLMTSFALNWMALANAASKIKAKFWYIRFSFFILILIALNFQFNTGRKNLEERYTEGNYWEQSHFRSIDLDSFRMKIHAMGIDRNTCVLAGYDPSPNNILYLLHLRGHRISKDHDNERMSYILNGAHPAYLISSDSSLCKQVSVLVKSIELKCTYKNFTLHELHYEKQ